MKDALELRQCQGHVQTGTVLIVDGEGAVTYGHSGRLRMLSGFDPSFLVVMYL